MYKLANTAGFLRDCIHQLYLNPVKNATLKLLDLARLYKQWKGLPDNPVREIARQLTMVGGQGKKNVAAK